MKCSYCKAIVTNSKEKTCPFCGRKLHLSLDKGLLIIFAVVLLGAIILAVAAYDPKPARNSSTPTEKMAMIDKNRFTPASYQLLLTAIQNECPNYSQQRIADMAAATF